MDKEGRLTAMVASVEKELQSVKEARAESLGVLLAALQRFDNYMTFCTDTPDAEAMSLWTEAREAIALARRLEGQ